ncbi:MAG: sigma-70 family RNA polymerase sigma factor [Flammeovirgaceae bacterium]|nr:sigma-70 family RNA polymerase sigma factor [Flammeovirgaceae bacterium]
MSNPLMMDDKALVSQVLNGDRMAFKQLIRQHERLVAHMIGRLIDGEEDRQELCQDVFLRVYDKLGEFTFQSKLSTWIATIAYRLSINHLRKKRIEVSDIPDEESFTTHFISQENPEEKLEDDEMNTLVLKLIGQLPTQYKVVLTLYHVDNMTYQEIEAVTGMPEGTVKNYLFRARHLLKESVKKYLGKEELI